MNIRHLKSLFISILWSIVIVTPAYAKPISEIKNTQTTPDGRFDSHCYPWGNDLSQELCQVSFYRLIAKPERYDGKLIQLTGFLIKTRGTFVIYPSSASFEASLSIESVELFDLTNVPLPKDITSTVDNGVFPVTVVGFFDAKYSGSNFLRLGAIRKVSHLLKVQKVR